MSILTSPFLAQGTNQSLIPDEVRIVILQDGGEGHGANVFIILNSIHTNPVELELVFFVGH